MIPYEQREYPNSVIIAPLPFFDMQLPISLLNDGMGGFTTINENVATTPRIINKSNGDEYGMVLIELSDLENDEKNLKAFFTANGLTMGGNDFTTVLLDRAWILSLRERNLFLGQNPLFQIVDGV